MYMYIRIAGIFRGVKFRGLEVNHEKFTHEISSQHYTVTRLDSTTKILTRTSDNHSIHEKFSPTKNTRYTVFSIACISYYRF